MQNITVYRNPMAREGDPQAQVKAKDSTNER